MTSSNNNGYDTMIEKLFTLFDSGQQINPTVQEILDALLKIIELLTGLKAGTKITSEQQVTKIFKVIADFLKDQHIKGEALFRHIRSLETGMKTRVKAGANLDPRTIASAVEYIFTSDAFQAKLAQQRGMKGNIDVSSMNSPLVVQAINNSSKNQKANLMLGLSNTQRAFISFLTGHYTDQDKKNKGLVKSLIDGLAANKFVGGAMQDTVKMLGLLAGSWIKNKVGGNLGGFLGASAVVLTQVIAGLVPVVLKAMFTAGFNRLFLGPLLKGASGAGGATGGGILASLLGLGAGQSNPVKTISKLSIKDKDAFDTAKKVARMSTTRTTSTGNIIGAVRDPSKPKPLPANAKLVASLNKNTTALAKNAGWLGKLINSPLLKGGGKLLGALGKFAVPAIAGIGAIGSGYAAYKDFKQGNIAGGAWNTVAGIADIATLLAPGFYKLIPIAISMFASWMASRSEKKSEVDKLLGTSPGRIFWVSPQHHLAGSSNGSTPYGSTHGGRGYVSSNLVNALDPRTHLSKDFKSFVKNQEGFRPYAYDDATGKRLNVGDIPIGTPTIGWGRAGKHRVKPGMTATKAQAEKWLNEDIYSAKGNLSSALKHWGFTAEQAQFPQEIYDMLVDSYFQSGFNPMGWKSPTQLVGLLKNKDWEGVKRFMSTYKHSSATRNAARAGYIDSHKKKAIPTASSQQTVTIQTPSVSSTTEEVRAPEEPKVEVKKEEQKADINEILKMNKPTIDGKSEKKEEEKVTGGLTADIAKAILNGVDIPGNDTTFDMMTKCNMAGLLGGY